jgi:hypothetical protein
MAEALLQARKFRSCPKNKIQSITGRDLIDFSDQSRPPARFGQGRALEHD